LQSSNLIFRCLPFFSEDEGQTSADDGEEGEEDEDGEEEGEGEEKEDAEGKASMFS
jgi:hypothetical protein